MMREMSQKEVDAQQERVTHLYQSKWLIDNLTAILMNMDFGQTGLNESTARVKAHAIENWLNFKKEMIAGANEPLIEPEPAENPK